MAKEQTMSYIKNSFLNSKTVSLKAAESGQSFNIHRDLLAAKSKTIISAFERGFVEGTKGIYTFQDTSDETLARFIEWAYTGDYPAIINPTSDHGRKTLKSEPDQPNHETDVTSENHPLLSHIHLYIFCSVYLIPDLQNLAFDRIRANFTELGKPDSPNTQLDVIAALRISFCKVLAPDPLLDWLAKYTAYTVDKLRVQSDFHDLLQESSSLTLRMVSLLNPARSAPWDNKPPKHDYQGPKTIGISDW
ncbi:hypothetical protein BDW59DRAFT_179746 [Aspergillus cavernicola]|uniref:BTB domain-containing protein n=1 Tax=Aspergillus cavernicola TaxID=176166 RepID=A0ABR4IDA2_9EURO